MDNGEDSWEQQHEGGKNLKDDLLSPPCGIAHASSFPFKTPKFSKPIHIGPLLGIVA